MKDVLTNHADASVRPSETVRMKNAAAETGIETEKEANKCSFTDAETAKAAVPDEACAEGTQQTASEEEQEERTALPAKTVARASSALRAFLSFITQIPPK